MDPQDKKDSVYLVLCDKNLPSELIHKIKGYLTQDDWKKKNTDYFDDSNDVNILKIVRTRMRNRSFTWPYYSLY